MGNDNKANTDAEKLKANVDEIIMEFKDKFVTMFTGFADKCEAKGVGPQEGIPLFLQLVSSALAYLVANGGPKELQEDRVRAGFGLITEAYVMGAENILQKGTKINAPSTSTIN